MREVVNLAMSAAAMIIMCLVITATRAASPGTGARGAVVADNTAAFSRFGKHHTASKCESITAEQCRSIGYNETRFPNFAGDESALAAAATLASYHPLIGMKCSEELVFFLCSVYFPMCTEKVPHPIGPCRPLCKRIQEACSPVLTEFNYDWPAALECSKFPLENSPEHMCMAGSMPSSFSDDEEDDEDDSTGRDASSGRGSIYGSIAGDSGVSIEGNKRPIDLWTLESATEARPGGVCARHDWIYVNRTAQCVPRCSTTLDYSVAEITTARSMLIIGSVVSVCITGICLIAAGIRGSPFTARRPVDRSLFFCTLCFALSSGLYAMSLMLRDSIACTHYNGHHVYAVRGLPNTEWCTLVATMLYYFGSAGRLWWLSLCAAWRWNLREHSIGEMERFVFRSHVICWALPLFLVMVALMAQTAGPELVSGVCLVGSATLGQHRVFIALRESLIMLGAVLVLISGCLNRLSSNAVALRSQTSSLPSAGFIGALYPLAAAFLLISSLQSQLNSMTGRWTPQAAFQLLADPSLGVLIGGSYFLYILYACYQQGPSSPFADKSGYHTPPNVYQQVGGPSVSSTVYYAADAGPVPNGGAIAPAVPQIPIPPVPAMA